MSLKERLDAIEGELIISFGNYGYKDMIENWFGFIKDCGLANNVLFFCLDDDIKKFCNQKGIKSYKWDSNQYKSYKECLTFNRNGCRNPWAETMAQKLEIISAILKEKRSLTYMDVDVIPITNPLPYINNLNIKNVGFMVEKQKSKNVCAGFLYTKSNSLTRILFDGKSIFKDKLYGTRLHDQELINNRIKRHKISVNYLDGNLFLNGRQLKKIERNNSININNSLVVHYNWIEGKKKKIEWMKKYGHYKV